MKLVTKTSFVKAVLFNMEKVCNNTSLSQRRVVLIEPYFMYTYCFEMYIFYGE